MEVRSLNHCGRVLLILSSYTDICFALEVDLLAEESDFQGFHQILLSGNFPEPEDPTCRMNQHRHVHQNRTQLHRNQNQLYEYRTHRKKLLTV